MGNRNVPFVTNGEFRSPSPDIVLMEPGNRKKTKVIQGIGKGKTNVIRKMDSYTVPICYMLIGFGVYSSISFKESEN